MVRVRKKKKTVSAYVVGFNRPDLLQEQKRLIDKFCPEISGLCCVDNTTGGWGEKMEIVCRENNVGYVKTPGGLSQHPDALRHIVTMERKLKSDYWITLDHDVFPREPVTLIDKIDKAGFYGIGQTHPPTLRHYLWPGFCSFSRKWLNGREPNFEGIRGLNPREDGDCGSMMYSLFTEKDWENLHRPEHGYGSIRPVDQYGLQSFGYEFFDGWVHFTNASHWMEVPDTLGRDRDLRNMIKAL